MGREDLDVGEVPGGLENAGDPEAGRGGVVQGCRSGAPGEALKLDGTAGIDQVERFGGHVNLNRCRDDGLRTLDQPVPDGPTSKLRH